MLSGWKDDLGNLLIFVSESARSMLVVDPDGITQAGLFSSVVTGFTVESYQWLSPDNSDISVQLLA